MTTVPVIAEYIWIDGVNLTRSKTRVFPAGQIQAFGVHHADYYPDWDYDGSSTGQHRDNDTEVVLKPKYVCPNPLFTAGNIDCVSVLVLCDTYLSDATTPHTTNNRFLTECTFRNSQNDAPWFGFEQEYFIMDYTSHSSSSSSTPTPPGPTVQTRNYAYDNAYCCPSAIHREIAEEHMSACLCAGLRIGGINAEVAPGQWEFQIGPIGGLEGSDQLWIARYLLDRIAAKYNKVICYHPKPYANHNGSGCHVNFSTRAMRETAQAQGVNTILNTIHTLAKTHSADICLYGTHNELRMTGKHETSKYDTFSWGIGTRNTSIRVGNKTHREGGGYFEDRRPASNCDPYVVVNVLYQAAADTKPDVQE